MFSTMRSSILQMNPPPSIKKVYVMITSDWLPKKGSMVAVVEEDQSVGRGQTTSDGGDILGNASAQVHVGWLVTPLQ